MSKIVNLSTKGNSVPTSLTYKRGDVVALNSGGNPMTIEECQRSILDGEERVNVVWMDDIGIVQRDSFLISLVRPFPNKYEAIRRSNENPLHADALGLEYEDDDCLEESFEEDDMEKDE